MPRKLTTAQPKFKILVANLAGGSDPSRGPSGNPVKIRTAFEQQHLVEVPGRGPQMGPGTQDEDKPGLRVRHWNLLETTAGVPVASAATLSVDDNDFSLPATLYLGQYVLVSDVDYVVGAGVAATATALAAAIDALPGYTAPVPGAAIISITGPLGPDGNDVLFEAIYGGDIQNFTLTPADGSLAGAEPFVGPVEITP